MAADWTTSTKAIRCQINKHWKMNNPENINNIEGELRKNFLRTTQVVIVTDNNIRSTADRNKQLTNSK